MNNGTNSDDDDIAQLVSQARAQRGGKPTKYVHLDRYSEIIRLVAADVQLPFILKWLADEKKEIIALNTLRKYVIFKIGRIEYEEYLRRNGWLKKKRAAKIVATPVPPESPDLIETQSPALPVSAQPAVVTKKPGNPLHALSGKPKENDFNHIPQAKIEIDIDKN